MALHSVLGCCFMMIITSQIFVVKTQENLIDQHSVQFGRLRPAWPAESTVFHMEWDLFTNDGLLFSDLSTLKFTSKNGLQSVVGDTITSGYKEGVGENAQFQELTGFVQLNSTMVIVVDRKTNCLRSVDRTSRATALFSGECSADSKGDSIDGHKPLYNSPTEVLQHNGYLYITESNNAAVRALNLKTKFVSTLGQLKQKLNGVSGIIIDPAGEFLYLTIKHGVVKMEVHSGYVTVLTSKERGYVDGTHRQTKFSSAKGLAWVTPNILAIADQSNNRIRFLNIETKEVTSMCMGKMATANSLFGSCNLDQPQSVLMHESTLYIGEYKTIRKTTAIKPEVIGK